MAKTRINQMQFTSNAMREATEAIGEMARQIFQPTDREIERWNRERRTKAKAIRRALADDRW